MEKKRIITIAGKPGSGKSTTAKLVSDTLGYERYSSGDFMRSLAKERGVTLEEMSKLAEMDDAIDREVDRYIQLLEQKDRFVIDSRLAFHWLPASYKVYLDLDLDIAAQRIFHATDTERFSTERAAENLSEYTDRIAARLESERRRYQKYYRLDPYDLAHFDIVIDTAEHTPDSIAKLIVDSYQSWLA